MKYLTLIPVLCLLLVPSVAFAQQIDASKDSSNPRTTPNYKPRNVLDGQNYIIGVNPTTGSKNEATHNWHEFTVDQGGLFRINQGEVIENMASVGVWSTLTNYGTMQVEGIWINDLVNTSSSLIENHGKLEVANFDGVGAIYNHGAIINHKTGTFDTHRGAIVKSRTFDNQGEFTNDGNLYIERHGVDPHVPYFHNFGTLTNTGGITLTGWSEFINRGKFINDQSLTIAGDSGGNATFANGDKTQLDGMSGTTLLSGGEDLAVKTHSFLNNYGQIKFDQPTYNEGTIYNGDSVYNPKAYMDLNNKMVQSNSGRLINEKGATLRGRDKISGGTFINKGTVIPTEDFELQSDWENSGTIILAENEAFVMEMDGNFYNRQGSSHEIELGGLFDGGGDHAITEFDWIDVTGNVELRGLLNVSLIDRFEKRINRGQVFEFLRVGGTLSGQYEGLGEGALVGNFGGQDLFITYGGMGDGGGVALFTNAVPEPTTMLIWSMLAGLGMTTRRRRAA